MAARKTHGQDWLGRVDGLGEQVRGQREGAEILKHVVWMVESRSIEISVHDPITCGFFSKPCSNVEVLGAGCSKSWSRNRVKELKIFNILEASPGRCTKIKAERRGRPALEQVSCTQVPSLGTSSSFQEEQQFQSNASTALFLSLLAFFFLIPPPSFLLSSHLLLSEIVSGILSIPVSRTYKFRRVFESFNVTSRALEIHGN